ncbi:serine/threonine-protein kinase [soil metagenome]
MNATGRRIGRYPIEGLIGTGGFATVYRARDERLDDVVAIKVLAENHSLDPQMRERFITEGCVLRRVKHPNVVAVYDLGETEGGQPFLVLEHADRGDLAGRVAGLRLAGYRPDHDDVRAVVVALGAAVASLHRLSVVHRDLSPANLLLRSDRFNASGTVSNGGASVLGGDERLLLADLGLCKDLARHSGLTVGGGTDGFCPQEQRRGSGTVDARADLWALSAIVVWLYTGHPPDPNGAWRKALASSGAPRPMADVLETGLAEDRGRRPESVATWSSSVLDALGDPAVSVVARPSPGDPAVASRRRRPAARRAGLVLMVLAVAAALVLGVLWQASDDRGTTVTSPAGAALIRSVASRGTISVAIVGPASVVAGDVARFRAEVDGASTWVWLAPDGTAYPDAPELAITAVTPGEALIHLAAVASDGQTTQATLRLLVKSPAE